MNTTRLSHCPGLGVAGYRGQEPPIWPPSTKHKWQTSKPVSLFLEGSQDVVVVRRAGGRKDKFLKLEGEAKVLFGRVYRYYQDHHRELVEKVCQNGGRARPRKGVSEEDKIEIVWIERNLIRLRHSLAIKDGSQAEPGVIEIGDMPEEFVDLGARITQKLQGPPDARHSIPWVDGAIVPQVCWCPVECMTLKPTSPSSQRVCQKMTLKSLRWFQQGQECNKR